MSVHDNDNLLKMIADARNNVGTAFIEYKQIKSVLQTLKLRLLVGVRSDLESDATTQAALTALVASTGTGKSRLVKRFLQSDEVNKLVAEGVKILFVVIPAQTTIKALTTAFLRALGDPLADRVSTTGRNSDRIVRLLRDLNYRFIVIDEFQHLIDDQMRTSREVADWLKVLLDSAGIPVMIVGLEEALHVMRQNPQLERRMTKIIRMRPMVWDWKEGTQEFRWFLREFERSLPLPDASNLSEPRLAHEIFRATDGLVGLVVQLMKEAVEITLLRNDGKQAVTREDLADAFDGLAFDKSNPFRSVRKANPTEPIEVAA